MHHLRFRQIHLDFHTSPAIDGIGAAFDKADYQKSLKDACVDSVTTFATCHHGWSYFDTEVGKRHPGLSFDLLRAQFDACLTSEELSEVILKNRMTGDQKHKVKSTPSFIINGENYDGDHKIADFSEVIDKHLP